MPVVTDKGDVAVGNYHAGSLFNAFERLTDVVHRTPCKESGTLNEWTDSEVYLKLENLQKTGSFKIRGAFNKISQLSETGMFKRVNCSFSWKSCTRSCVGRL